MVAGRQYRTSTGHDTLFTCAGHADAMRIARAALTSWLLPVPALAVVLLLDLIARSRDWSVPVIGVLDEPAHLATALLVLLAVAGPRWLLDHLPYSCSAAIASVAIDLDHLPLYAGLPVAVDGGRPFTHCLLTAVVLAAAGLVVRRWRPILIGLSTGVLLHLMRDLPTGPGVSLFWPVSSARFEMPYAAYLLALALCAAVAMVRAAAERRPAPGGANDQHHATIG